MEDPLDVSLQDDELLAEVELTTTLIIAVSDSAIALTPAQVDHLLGLGGGRRGSASPRPAPGGLIRHGWTQPGRDGLEERPRSPETGPLEGRGPGDRCATGMAHRGTSVQRASAAMSPAAVTDDARRAAGLQA